MRPSHRPALCALPLPAAPRATGKAEKRKKRRKRRSTRKRRRKRRHTGAGGLPHCPQLLLGRCASALGQPGRWGGQGSLTPTHRVSVSAVSPGPGVAGTTRTPAPPHPAVRGGGVATTVTEARPADSFQPPADPLPAPPAGALAPETAPGRRAGGIAWGAPVRLWGGQVQLLLFFFNSLFVLK